MKYYLICDYRENFKSILTENKNILYNDHPSKKNVNEVLDAINSLGYNCEYFGGIPELIHAVDTHAVFEDCRFINFTDGMEQNYSRVQAPVLLDILNTDYSGSGVFASVLMNNKHYCKQALLEHNIFMPRSCIVNSFIPFESSLIKSWIFPIFVKPNCEGSSLGISEQNVCHSYDEVYHMVNSLLSEYDEIILEEYIEGIDVTDFVIGNPGNYVLNDTIVTELFDSSPYAVYGAKEKYNKLRKLYLNTEKLNIKVCEKIQNTSIQIAKALEARDICRIDYRYNYKDNQFYFLEINSAPRFSKTSEIGFIAEKRDMSFSSMLDLYISAFISRISTV